MTVVQPVQITGTPSLTSDFATLHTDIPVEAAGQRLDRCLAERFDGYARSRLTTWIRAGRVLVDGQPRKPTYKVCGGEAVIVHAERPPPSPWRPEAVDFPVVHEDAHVLVINKPVGLVVHPAVGHWSGTLVNGLLHAYPEQARLPRAGIVHRLDKDTSGLLVVARTLTAHTHLAALLAMHAVRREYQAVVQGALTGGGVVDAPIARHPRDRKRMAVCSGGRRAVTHYRLIRPLAGGTQVRLRLETGRTHQIRVHMAHIHHPLVGDPVYAGRSRLPKGIDERVRTALRCFPRQALHAAELAFKHPDSGAPVTFTAPLPADMQALLATLADAACSSGAAP